MVNVHIHQFKAGGTVVDAAALEQFQEQWATYRKLVESDLLSHCAVGRLLHDNLNQRFTAPFTFLDIACGDASMMKRALTGTKVRHYHGIDLSQRKISPPCRLRSISITAISSTRCRAVPSTPTRPGAAYRSIISRPTTSSS